MRRTLYFVVAASLAVALRGQPPGLPDTYSFTAIASTVSRPLSITVHRNGSREVIERATVGAPEKFHDRVWYDFQAHRLYTLNLNSNICSTQVYASAWAPGLIDPIGAAAEGGAGPAGAPPQAWKRDNINGLAVKVMEVAGPQGKMKTWVDEKFNFLVRLDMAMGNEPLTTRYEIQQLSYAPSADSVFVHPPACEQIGGVDTATGGHAEMHVGANVAVQTPQPAAAPQPAKVTAVRLRLVPESYAGPCPSPVQLVAAITTDGPGSVWYRFLAGAVVKNGPSEGTVRFSAAGTREVALAGAIRATPAVPETKVIATMEDAEGKHGPQTVSSNSVNYNRTCQR